MAPEPTNNESLAGKLAALRAGFLARMPDELAMLQAGAARLVGSEADRHELEELRHRLHKLAGSGGTFGLMQLSQQARTLEQRVNAWLKQASIELDQPRRQQLAADMADLHACLSASEPATGMNWPQTTDNDKDKYTATSVWVWLVEDDIALGRELQRQLESFGYQVSLFSQLSEVEALAEQQRPDMLITDVLFPEQDENATEALLARPALQQLDCPYLFFSARDDFHSRLRAARMGAAAYFIKPLDVPRLVNRMVEIFARQNAPPQRVLIVDDDTELAAHYRLVLMSAGMEVEVLSEPEAIIETVSVFRPELILMDLHMPTYSGPELAGVIRQYDKWAGLPIVYLSAETDLDRQLDAMGQGADDFLTKPISDNQLVAAVRVRVERARQLDAQINRDSLTGLLKHASVKEGLEVEVARAKRNAQALTVAMVDIDYFKQVNDSYGHAAGDIVISALAMLLRQRLRHSDLLGRYGGEEFVAVLPECNRQNAYVIMDDIRQRFASVRFTHAGEDFSCALSAGLATLADQPKADGAALLMRADESLYTAKRAGRNRVQ